MPTTKNIILVRASGTAIDYSYSAAASNSKIIVLLMKNGGVVSSKKTVPNGGASGDIDLVAGTKFTVNYNAIEVEQLLDGVLTHKVIDETSGVPLVIFDGTVTVEESGDPIIDYSQYEVRHFSQKQNFSEEANFGIQLPKGAVVKEVVIWNKTDNESELSLVAHGIDDSEQNISGQTVTAQGLYRPVVSPMHLPLEVPSNLRWELTDGSSAFNFDCTIIWLVLPQE